MKNENKGKKQKNPLLIPVILLSATVIMLAVMLLLPEPAEGEKIPGTAASAAADTRPAETSLPAATAPEDVTESQTTGYYEATGPAVETEPPVEDIQISTPYATLYYPGQWEEYLRVEQVEMEMGVIVMFLGRIDDVEVELFNISFGGSEGIPVGIYSPDGGVQMDVTAAMTLFTPDESWSQADSERLMAMQEAMNHVIERLRREASIIPAA